MDKQDLTTETWITETVSNYKVTIKTIDMKMDCISSNLQNVMKVVWTLGKSFAPFMTIKTPDRKPLRIIALHKTKIKRICSSQINKVTKLTILGRGADKGGSTWGCGRSRTISSFSSCSPNRAKTCEWFKSIQVQTSVVFKIRPEILDKLSCRAKMT